MDLVLLVSAVLFLCTRSSIVGISMAITAIVYVIIRTIVDLEKKGVIVNEWKNLCDK